jgi:predicted anti-sigma-YlaC factor YlaD
MQPPLSCENALELISAAIDGEATDVEQQLLDAHLDTCVECVVLEHRVRRLHRQVRLRSAELVPNLVAIVTDRVRPATLGRGGWLRPAMAWLAVVTVVQNVAALVLGHVEGADEHLARHLGAFGVALGVGFAYTAWKPQRAVGMLPFAAALIATMLISAVLDVAAGGRSALAESVHVTEVVGLVLLWLIAGSPGWHGRHHLSGRTARRA